MKKLALLGGQPEIDPASVPQELFKWPIITEEDEAAVLDVLYNNSMSAYDITEKFQDEFAAWIGRKYAIAYCNGTLSLEAAMYGVGLGAGDEIICPTKTYWASCIQAARFGASVVFANIKTKDSMNIDPDDLERCLGPRTKAIMVVHYCAMPADMDPIMEFAKKHDLKVIEDVSHAQGGMYHGKRLGTFGDVSAMSLMSQKSFACGEMGMLVTNNTEIYERAMAYSHYERNNEKYIKETEYLKPYYHIALGGVKGRVNQMSSAMGRVQLKYYDERCAEIRKAMNYFCDLLEGTKGIKIIRTDESEGNTMGGWYNPQALYFPEELEGLPVSVYAEAVKAETGGCFTPWSGANFPLHTHNYFKTFDLMNIGRPLRTAFADRDVRELDKSLVSAEKVICFSIPWFKKYIPEVIEAYARAFRNVSECYEQLKMLNAESDGGGRWYGAENKTK